MDCSECGEWLRCEGCGEQFETEPYGVHAYECTCGHETEECVACGASFYIN